MVVLVQGCSVPSFFKKEIKKGIATSFHRRDDIKPYLIFSFRNNPVIVSSALSIAGHEEKVDERDDENEQEEDDDATTTTTTTATTTTKTTTAKAAIVMTVLMTRLTTKFS